MGRTAVCTVSLRPMRACRLRLHKNFPTPEIGYTRAAGAPERDTFPNIPHLLSASHFVAFPSQHHTTSNFNAPIDCSFVGNILPSLGGLVRARLPCTSPPSAGRNLEFTTTFDTQYLLYKTPPRPQSTLSLSYTLSLS